MGQRTASLPPVYRAGMAQWAVAYLITCLVEVPLVVVLVRGLGWRSDRTLGVVLLAWLLQFTHPVLWLAHPATIWGVVVAEAVVVGLEGLALYWWATRRAAVRSSRLTLERALLVALVANAASVLVGLVTLTLLPAWLAR